MRKYTVHILILAFVFFVPLLSFSQSSHPRSLIQAEDLPAIRQKIQRGKTAEMFRQFRKDVEEREVLQKKGELDDLYDNAYFGADLAAMYMFTEKSSWAQKAYAQASKLIQDTIFTDPFSRGLTRAMLLQNVTLIYDFCYQGWNTAQRKTINDALFTCMFSVNANMGFSANYNIDSNWMGVRFGAVMLAAMVWDDPLVATGKRSRALPLLWDASKRMGEHIEKNIYTNGWNGESLGYHVYDWSFIGPALIAQQNRHPGNQKLQLAAFVPRAMNSLHAQSISNVSLKNASKTGIKIDLSDDNMNGGPLKLLVMGLALYPEHQHPALKWMFDYFTHRSEYPNYRSTLVYSILYYPEDLTPVNPQSLGWTTYHDPEQGIVILRDRFYDAQDMVIAYSTTAKRVRGHQGPDTNTLRMIGLGVPWVIGAGRTGYSAGQSTLFPDPGETIERGSKGLGTLHTYAFTSPHSGYAIGSGSCVGTKNHRRFFQADMENPDAEAVVVISDSSDNGKRWRINTPEFNQFSPLDNGYLLTAPNGSTMRVQVVGQSSKVVVTEEKVRYGGKTVRLNPGIGFEGKGYAFSRAIDLECAGDITVVITLQPSGEMHPEINWNASQRSVSIGSQTYTIQ